MTESFDTPLTNSIPDEDIAKRAFELYDARGRQDGHDVEDWLQERAGRGFVLPLGPPQPGPSPFRVDGM